MNKRLQQFLAAENISQSQFADSIGVARASISHILAGRNKPGFDFIQAMMRRYPNLSMEWMIDGKGKMYKGIGKSPLEDIPDSLFDDPVEIEEMPQEGQNEAESAHSAEDTDTSAIEHVHAPAGRSIEKIIVFYSDGTFQELK